MHTAGHILITLQTHTYMLVLYVKTEKKIGILEDLKDSRSLLDPLLGN